MYQWKWQKVDKPGIWACGGTKKSSPPLLQGEAAVISEPMLTHLSMHATDAWRCYLGPIPDIAPPEPELRLPEWWSHEERQQFDLWYVSLFDQGIQRVLAVDPDKATAIRAAQAAMDVMTGGES